MSPWVLLGSPGTGRSACPSRLSERLGLPTLSVRKILHSAAQAKTAKRLRYFLDGSTPIPAPLVLSLLTPHLEQLDPKQAAILSGFPQTLAQAQALDTWLIGRGLAPSHATKLELSHDDAVRRLNGRRFCRRCPNTFFNIFFSPPQDDGRCDACHEPLYQRTQDRLDLVLRRLARRAQEDMPLERYYESLGHLHRVDAHGSLSDVVERVCEGMRAPLRMAMGF